MAKREFLVPLAAAIAALTGTSQAAVDKAQPEKTDRLGIDVAPTTTAKVDVMKEGQLLMPVGEDVFKWVLKRGRSGEMVADHFSHSSHSSHRSHYSSRY